jgi:hypothetical protein
VSLGFCCFYVVSWTSLVLCCQLSGCVVCTLYAAGWFSEAGDIRSAVKSHGGVTQYLHDGYMLR